MLPFIPAKELKEDFGIYGHFYSVEIAPDEIVHCRSVLEICHHDETPADLSRLSARRPDAVFIMMNPGSSKPLVPVNNETHARAIGELETSLVPTRPDTTQYQVMRLMRFRGWRHVRVLNLSDLRCTKSPEFIKLFQRLEAERAFEAHSLFAAERADELAFKLRGCGRIPLVFAWGISDKLTPLIERCLSRVSRRSNVYGLLADGTENKYRHPLPSLQKDQREWVEQMVQQFEK